MTVRLKKGKNVVNNKQYKHAFLKVNYIINTITTYYVIPYLFFVCVTVDQDVHYCIFSPVMF